MNSFFLSSTLILILVQCGNLKRAELLFDQSDKNHLPLYGAMMKGNTD